MSGCGARHARCCGGRGGRHRSRRCRGTSRYRRADGTDQLIDRDVAAAVAIPGTGAAAGRLGLDRAAAERRVDRGNQLVDADQAVPVQVAGASGTLRSCRHGAQQRGERQHHNPRSERRNRHDARLSATTPRLCGADQRTARSHRTGESVFITSEFTSRSSIVRSAGVLALRVAPWRWKIRDCGEPLTIHDSPPAARRSVGH